jgi:hypothetical protein
MSRFTEWLLNLPERRAQARERRREREAQSAYARLGSDPNPAIHQRHGESARTPFPGSGDGGGGAGGAAGGG